MVGLPLVDSVIHRGLNEHTTVLLQCVVFFGVARFKLIAGEKKNR